MRCKIICLIFVVLLSIFVAAEDAPPTLENHQFYGEVHWDADKVVEKVIAKVGDEEFTSTIKTDFCGDNTCSGKYGHDTNNILRVLGKKGDSVLVFVDGVLVQEVLYESGGTTELKLNLATKPLDKPACNPDWDCGTLSECVEGKQTQDCTDKNKCNPDELEKTEEKSCGVTVVETEETITCEYEWDCTTWSSCTSSKQSRMCNRIDICDTLENAILVKFDKPLESKFCFVQGLGELPQKEVTPSIEQFKKDVVEEDEEKEGLSVWVYVGGFMIFLAIIIIAYFVFFRRKQETFYG